MEEYYTPQDIIDSLKNIKTNVKEKLEKIKPYRPIGIINSSRAYKIGRMILLAILTFIAVGGSILLLGSLSKSDPKFYKMITPVVISFVFLSLIVIEFFRKYMDGATGIPIPIIIMISIIGIALVVIFLVIWFLWIRDGAPKEENSLYNLVPSITPDLFVIRNIGTDVFLDAYRYNSLPRVTDLNIQFFYSIPSKQLYFIYGISDNTKFTSMLIPGNTLQFETSDGKIMAILTLDKIIYQKNGLFIEEYGGSEIMFGVSTFNVIRK